MRERGGRTRAMVVQTTDAGTIQNEIHGAVAGKRITYKEVIA